MINYFWKPCDPGPVNSYYQGEEQRNPWFGGSRKKDVTPLEDSQIIALFWAREEEAIAQTHAAYGRKLFCLSERILGSRQDAEERVNDTYLKVWNLIPPQRPRFFYAFLASICRHLSFHRLDWNQAAKRKAQVVCLTEEMELCIPDPSRERELEAREIGQALTAFLETLPQETRLIFLRRYWHLDTIAQIAARYGLTESKVKMQLSRTREKLRTFLEQEEITV